MDRSLYHEQWGYYHRNRQKIGKDGDFYTNSSVGDVFGEIWAEQFVEIWRESNIQSVPHYIILEVGGGNGQFARSVLTHLQTHFPDYYEKVNYILAEKSHYHRQLQQELLSPFDQHTSWVDDLHVIADQIGNIPKIIFTNELFDALPVERIRRDRHGIKQCWVKAEGDRLIEEWLPLEDQSIIRHLEEMELTLPMGHEIEVPLAAKEMYRDLVEALGTGTLFTVDYGFRFDELLLPHRKKGTLMGYGKHLHRSDWYENPGEIDLTAHVHFDALMKWGRNMGLEHVSYQTQREWLMGRNIFSKLQEHHDPNPFNPVAKRNRAILQLLTPGGMGDTFKVLTQRKIEKE
jgi:SAM-dependent MidA family methyltransferase